MNPLLALSCSGHRVSADRLLPGARDTRRALQRTAAAAIVALL
jgi:hypothetical protein